MDNIQHDGEKAILMEKLTSLFVDINQLNQLGEKEYNSQNHPINLQDDNTTKDNVQPPHLQQHTKSTYKQKFESYILEIRSILPELINSYLVSSASTKDINQIVILINFIKKLQNSNLAFGDSTSICSYLFKLIPFLSHKSSTTHNNNNINNNQQQQQQHDEEDEFTENLITTIINMLHFLTEDLNVLLLFFKETIYLFNDCIDFIKENSNNQDKLQNIYPIVLKTYCELSSSIVSDSNIGNGNMTNTSSSYSKTYQSLDLLVQTEMAFNQIEKNKKKEQTTTTFEEKEKTSTYKPVDDGGVLIVIPSTDRLINLQSGLLIGISSVIENFSHFFLTQSTDLWNILYQYLILLDDISLSSYKYMANFIYSLLDLFEKLLKTSSNEIPILLYNDIVCQFINVLLPMSMLIDGKLCKKRELIDQKLALILPLLFSNVSDSTLFEFSSIILPNVLFVINNTTFKDLKVSILDIYFKILKLSTLQFKSLYSLVPLFGDQDIHEKLNQCFDYVITQSYLIDSDDQPDISLEILNTLIDYTNCLNISNIFEKQVTSTTTTNKSQSQSKTTCSPQLISQPSIGQLKSIRIYIKALHLIFKICKNHHNRISIKEPIQLFIDNLNQIYNILIKQKELSTLYLEILIDLFNLSITIEIEYIHRISSLKSNEILMDSLFKLSMITGSNSTIFNYSKYHQLIDSIKILCFNVISWLPGGFYQNERVETVLSALSANSGKDNTIIISSSPILVNISSDSSGKYSDSQHINATSVHNTTTTTTDTDTIIQEPDLPPQQEPSTQIYEDDYLINVIKLLPVFISNLTPVNFLNTVSTNQQFQQLLNDIIKRLEIIMDSKVSSLILDMIGIIGGCLYCLKEGYCFFENLNSCAYLGHNSADGNLIIINNSILLQKFNNDKPKDRIKIDPLLSNYNNLSDCGLFNGIWLPYCTCKCSVVSACQDLTILDLTSLKTYKSTSYLKQRVTTTTTTTTTTATTTTTTVIDQDNKQVPEVMQIEQNLILESKFKNEIQFSKLFSNDFNDIDEMVDDSMDVLNDIDSSIKYFYLGYTFKSILIHNSPLPSTSIEPFFKFYLGLLSSNKNNLIRKLVIKIIVTMLKYNHQSNPDVLTNFFIQLHPLYLNKNDQREEDLLFSILYLLKKIANLVINSTKEQFNQQQQQIGGPSSSSTSTTSTNYVNDITSTGNWQDKIYSNDFILITMCSLIENLSKSTSIKVASIEIIEFIAKKLGQTPKQLITVGMSQYITPRIIENIYSNKQSLIELCRYFLQCTLEQFLRSSLPIVMPILIFKAKNSSNILNSISEELPSFIKDLINENIIGLICEYIFLNSTSRDHLASCIADFATYAGFDHQTLASNLPKSFINSLILNLANYDNGENIEKLQQAKESIIYASVFLGKTDFKKFLIDEFLGLMNFFTLIMNNKSKSIQEKLTVVKSFKCLLEWMGDSVNLFRPKIMVFLRLASKAPLQSLAIDIWYIFIKLLKIANIGPILNQILSSITPYVPNYPDKSVLIFDYLIVQNCDELKPYFKTVIFLKEYPVLKPYIQQLESENSNVTLQTQISQLIELFTNASEVKVLALGRLKQLLENNRNEIYKMISRDSDQELLNNLVKSLLIGCRDPKTVFSFLECLGELGAIDPAKLDFSLRNQSPAEKDKIQIAAELIEDYLSNFVLSPSFPTPQDRAGYAIQEILKSLASDQKLLFSKLTPECADVIKPYRSSEYHLKHSSISSNSATDVDKKTNTHGIYFSPTITHQKWISTWLIDLLYKTKGPLDAIFIASRAIVKDDLKICHYLLPLVILNIIDNGKETDIISIKNEILEVLNNDTDLNSENGQMSTQIIFHVINCLINWIDIRKKKFNLNNPIVRKTPKQKRIESPEVVSLERFLAGIPEKILASAAYRCKSLSSSLNYMESLIRNETAQFQKQIQSQSNNNNNQLVNNSNGGSGSNGSGGVNGQLTFKQPIQPIINQKNLPVINAREQALNNNLQLLQKIYHEMDDVDDLVGLSHKRLGSPTSDEMIVELESQGFWGEALLYYNNALEKSPSNMELRFGALNCLFNLGQYEPLLLQIEGLKQEPWLTTKDQSRINSLKVSTCWRLSNWDKIEDAISQPFEQNFETYIGKILFSLVRKQEKEFNFNISQCRTLLSQYLAGSSLDSYQRCYPYLVQNQILNEIENSFKLIHSFSSSGANNQQQLQQQQELLNSTLIDWDNRLNIAQPSFKTRESILGVRREILEIGSFSKQVVDCWMKIGKYARHDKKYELSLNAILKPTIVQQDKFYFIERAKLNWHQGNSFEAINILKQELKNRLGDISVDSINANNINKDVSNYNKLIHMGYSVEDIFLISKTNLLVARWKQQCGITHHLELTDHYILATTFEWEKGFFFLGRYYDSLLTNLKRDGNTNTPNSKPIDIISYVEFTKNVLASYSQAVILGHSYIYQTLTRIITLWCEFGSIFLDFKYPEKVSRAISSDSIESIKRSMSRLDAEIPASFWLIFLSQLASRMSHKNAETWGILEKIIVKTLTEYPKHANWIMMVQIRSNASLRKNRARNCLEKAQKNESIKRNQDEMNLLGTHLLSVSNFPPQNKQTNQKSSLKMSEHFKKLYEMKYLTVILPLQTSMNVNLPPNGRVDKNFQAFGALPTIQSFDDHIDVMPSLQGPKKIMVNDNHGNKYSFLLKPNDDLRKDTRVMEFNTMVNKLVKRDPACRKRNLKIRTYSVVPLNEESGIIEWVFNTSTLRSVLNSIYETMDCTVESKKIVQLVQAKKEKNHLELYEDFNRYFPPVLYKFFLAQFPEASSWLDARNAFARSCAIMSIVGSVLGLGDRHTENILLDSSSGECVHIDYNCLFWKGETFKVPERVPFRLTRNMVDVFGVLGVEGTFKIVCENTLRVLRNNKEVLLRVLEAFIYDPFLEIFDTKKSNVNNPPVIAAEAENEQAVEILKRIGATLQGIPTVGLQLSIEGQVNHLIQEATDPKHLCNMYVGWCSWY